MNISHTMKKFQIANKHMKKYSLSPWPNTCSPLPGVRDPACPAVEFAFKTQATKLLIPSLAQSALFPGWWFSNFGCIRICKLGAIYRFPRWISINSDSGDPMWYPDISILSRCSQVFLMQIDPHPHFEKFYPYHSIKTWALFIFITPTHSP